ncbi:MAG: hypothetical protein ABJB33_00650 [Gemmatimonadota bacterium]
MELLSTSPPRQGWSSRLDGRRFILVGAALLFLCACGFDRPVAPTDRLPVVQGLLIAGEDSQFFRLTWADSPDSAYAGTPDPILLTDVALTVSGPGGTQPLVPLGSGIFTIILPILPDSTYQLSGTIAGAAISATTRVPGAFIVAQPAADTVVITEATDCADFPDCHIPIDLSATGATRITIEVRDSSNTILQVIEPVAGDTVLTLIPFKNFTRLYFYALDANAAAFVYTEEPASSVTGGYGLFGSALLVRKGLRWQ